MQEEVNTFEKISENLKEYINTRYDLTTLKVTEKVSNIGSQAVATSLLILFGSMFLFFINMALAFWLSTIFKNTYAGFFIVAGFYLLLVLFIFLFKKKLIITPLRNFIIKQILSDN